MTRTSVSPADPMNDDTDGAPDMTSTTLPAEIGQSPTPAGDDDTSEGLAASRRDTPRVTRRRIVSAEWFKFRTVRSNPLALVGALAAAIGLGAMFSSLGEPAGPGFVTADGLSLSLGGFDLAHLIIAILGVSLVTGDYQTGLIRTWFAAVPRRLEVLWAKVVVYGGIVFGLSLVAASAAFLVGQALIDPSMSLGLTDAGVARAILGTALYAACIGVIGIGLGFLTRSTSAGTSLVVGLMMLLPLLTRMLPDSIGDPIFKILPSSAADAVAGTGGTDPALLSSGWGLVILVGWVVAIIGSAAVSLRRRDA